MIRSWMPLAVLILTKGGLKYNADKAFACFAPPEPWAGANSISVYNPIGGILGNVLIHEQKVQMRTLLNELRNSRILGKVALEFHIQQTRCSVDSAMSS